MARGSKFDVNIQTSGMGLDAKALEQAVLDSVYNSMNQIGLHAAGRAKVNAPFGTPFSEGGGSPNPGALRASIHHTIARNGQRVAVNVLATMPYALRMHEELTPAGPLQLGKRSRQQPWTREGNVGGKYIERVVYYHFRAYEQFIATNLVRDLQGKARQRLRGQAPLPPGQRPPPPPTLP